MGKFSKKIDLNLVVHYHLAVSNQIIDDFVDCIKEWRIIFYEV